MGIQKISAHVTSHWAKNHKEDYFINGNLFLCAEELRDWFSLPKDLKRVQVVIQGHPKGEWKAIQDWGVVSIATIRNTEHQQWVYPYRIFLRWLQDEGGLVPGDRFKMWVEYDG